MKREWLNKIIFFCVFFGTSIGLAQRVDFRTRTYLLAYPDRVNGSRIFMLPLYEFLDLGIQDMGVKGLGLNISGYGLLNAYDVGDMSRVDGDLDEAYISYSSPSNSLEIQAGRMLVFDGGGFGDAIDGGRLYVMAPLGFNLTVFGGCYVEEGFSDSGDTYLYGGRFGHRMLWKGGFTDVGVSYVKRVDDGNVDRELISADLSWYAPEYVNLSGSFYYDNISKDLARVSSEVDINIRWNLSLDLDYSYLQPSLFLSKNSIFYVFADDAQHQAGSSLRYQVDKWRFGTGFYWMVYKGMRDGYWAWLNTRYVFNKRDFIGVGFSRYRDVDNGYYRVRLYARYVPERLQHLVITGDIQTHLMDKDVFGTGYVVFANTAAGYRFKNGIRITISGMIQSDPFVKYSIAGLARLSYGFDGGDR